MKLSRAWMIALTYWLVAGCGPKESAKQVATETPMVLANRIAEELSRVKSAGDVPAAKIKLQELVSRIQTMMKQDRTLDRLVPDEQFKLAVERVQQMAAALERIRPEIKRIDQSISPGVSDELLTAIKQSRAALNQPPIDVNLPDVQQAIRAGLDANNLTHSQGNLRTIAQLCVSYATEHGGKYPPDLKTAIASTSAPAPAETFRCPRGGTKLPDNAETMTKPQIAQWAEQIGDYIYLGAGKTIASASHSIVLVENPQRVTKIATTVRGDGVVDVAPVENVAKLITDPH